MFFFNVRPKFNKTAGLAPCDIKKIFSPKFDKTAGLAPCDWFNVRPKVVWRLLYQQP